MDGASIRQEVSAALREWFSEPPALPDTHQMFPEDEMVDFEHLIKFTSLQEAWQHWKSPDELAYLLGFIAENSPAVRARLVRCFADLCKKYALPALNEPDREYASGVIRFLRQREPIAPLGGDPIDPVQVIRNLDDLLDKAGWGTNSHFALRAIRFVVACLTGECAGNAWEAAFWLSSLADLACADGNGAILTALLEEFPKPPKVDGW